MFHPFSGDEAGRPEELNRAFNRESQGTSVPLLLKRMEEDWLKALEDDELSARMPSLLCAVMDWQENNHDYLGSAIRRGWHRTVVRKFCRSGFEPWLDGFVDRCLAATIENGPLGNVLDIADLEALKRFAQLAAGIEAKQFSVPSYRILFPTVDKKRERGSLVWVKIRVVQRDTDNLPEETLVVAPWSFFEPGENLKKLSEVLPAALAAAGITKGSTHDTPLFVIELLPVYAADPDNPWPLKPTSEDCLRGLTPPALTIEGSSLGLAVAIASWAAHERLSIPPLVATGELQEDGCVAKVDEIDTKWDAVKQFAEVSGSQLQILLPRDNHELANEESPCCKLRWVTSLQKDVFRPGLLCDGFDAYRAIWTNASADESALPECLKQTRRLHFDDDPRAAKGLASCELEELRKLRDQILDKATGSQPKFLTLPFNESVQDIAWHLVDLVMKKVVQQPAAHLSTLPVCLAVTMDVLLSPQIDGDFAAELPRRLADWIQNKLGEGVRPDPQAIAEALRRSGKLIIVVYEDPSIELWNEVSDPERYRERLKMAWRLLNRSLSKASSRPRISWEPQRLVAICSDTLHEQFWKAAIDHRTMDPFTH